MISFPLLVLIRPPDGYGYHIHHSTFVEPSERNIARVQIPRPLLITISLSIGRGLSFGTAVGRPKIVALHHPVTRSQTPLLLPLPNVTSLIAGTLNCTAIRVACRTMSLFADQHPFYDCQRVVTMTGREWQEAQSHLTSHFLSAHEQLNCYVVPHLQ
jgi:hypothetical protein